MFLNERQPSDELRTLCSLNSRSVLSKEDYHYYLNLEKGLEGELKLDKLLEEALADVMILRDLTFEINNTIFQIDTLLIFQKCIYLLDVKNNQGDFCVEGEIWKSPTGNEMKNPLHQLSRCTSLFKHLLQRLGFTSNINASLVYVHPEFTLYQAPRRQDIVFPTQLNRFIGRLKQESCNYRQDHHRLAKQLLSQRVLRHRHETDFDYEFNSLKKGIVCFDCGGFMSRYSLYQLVCDKCNKTDYNEICALKNINEFEFLFPNKKITLNNIYNWCGEVLSIDVIRNVLRKNYRLLSRGKASYYLEEKASDQK